MANKTTSTSASKKELSSIVSNLLAEQQKLSERISELEQRGFSRPAPTPRPPEVRVNITEEDIDKAFARFFKHGDHKMVLSQSTINTIAKIMSEGMVGQYKTVADKHADFIKDLYDNYFTLSREIYDIKEVLEGIEQRQRDEAQKAEAAAKSWETRVAKYTGHGIVNLIKCIYKFLAFVLRNLKKCGTLILNVVV